MVNSSEETLNTTLNYVNTRNLARLGYDRATLIGDLAPIRSSPYDKLVALYHTTILDDAVAFLCHLKHFDIKSVDDLQSSQMAFGSLHFSKVDGKWGAQNCLLRSWVEVDIPRLVDYFQKALNRI